MSRRSLGANTSVSLFPFLAVLVCAMGALILLLLVTTRKIRSDQVAQSAPAALNSAASGSILATNSEPVIPDPVPPPVEADGAKPLAAEENEAAERAAAERAAHMAAVEAAQRELQALREQWARRVHQLEQEQQRRLAELERLQTQAESEANAIEEARRRGEAVTQRLEAFTQQREAAGKREQALREQYAQIEAELQQAQAQLEANRDAQRAAAEAGSRYAVTVYDYRTGTSRRPILIECTGEGFRFLPEDVRVTAADLEAFSPHFNPLLAGSVELLNYWVEQNERPSNSDEAATPYVLLLVRPSGTKQYYKAREALAELGSTFGYELVDESLQLQLPAASEEARRRVRSAIDRVLQERERQFVSSPAGGGFGGRSQQLASVHSGSPGNDSVPGGRSRRTEPLTIDGRTLADDLPEQPRVIGRLDVPPTVAKVLLNDTRANATPARQPGGRFERVSTAEKREGSKSPTSQDLAVASRSALHLDPKSADASGPAKPPEGIAPLRLTEADLKREEPNSAEREQSLPRRWGVVTPGQGVALTRQVTLRVEHDRIIVDGQHAIYAGKDASWNTIANELVTTILQQRNNWGPPPPKFYWMPAVHFEVVEGGGGLHEQVNRLLHSGGIKTTTEFLPGTDARPQVSGANGSNSGGTNPRRGGAP